MTNIHRLVDRIDRLSEGVGRAAAWLTLVMVLVTFAVVVLRYLFNVGFIAMQESVTYMHAVVFMLGAAYTLRNGGHVRVDIFYRAMAPRRRAWVDLLGTLLFLLPMFGFILWLSWGYVAASWRVMEGSPEAGGLPLVFLLKSLILVMPALMILQGVANGLRALLQLLGAPLPEGGDQSPEV